MPFEVDLLNVGEGSGDAICLRYGTPQAGYIIHVVDGGHGDTAETIINHLTTHYEAAPYISHMVLSHADDDHARGLIDVLKSFPVGTIWMNRPWLFASEVIQSFHGNWTEQGLVDYIRAKHPYLVKIEGIANQRGIPIYDAFQGAQIGAFRVLAPSRARYVELIPDLEKTPESYAEDKGGFAGALAQVGEDIRSIVEGWNIETLSNSPPATSASNETSIVQIGTIDGQSILLTADVGPVGLQEAAAYAESIGMLVPPDLVQVPHHGSRRNVTPQVLDWWLGTRTIDNSTTRGVAVCSVGSNKTEHPRKKVSNAFLRRGYPVYCTRPRHLRHQHNMPVRPGWGSAFPEPFHDNVED